MAIVHYFVQPDAQLPVKVGCHYDACRMPCLMFRLQLLWLQGGNRRGCTGCRDGVSERQAKKIEAA